MKGLFAIWERTMAAAAFAEQGLFDMAVEVAEGREETRDRARIENRARAPRPRPVLRAPSLDE